MAGWLADRGRDEVGAPSCSVDAVVVDVELNPTMETRREMERRASQDGGVVELRKCQRRLIGECECQCTGRAQSNKGTKSRNEG